LILNEGRVPAIAAQLTEQARILSFEFSDANFHGFEFLSLSLPAQKGSSAIFDKPGFPFGESSHIWRLEIFCGDPFAWWRAWFLC